MARETSPTTTSFETASASAANVRHGIGQKRAPLLSGRIPGLRGAIAALVLITGVAAVLIAADSGPIRVGAGDMDIVLARGDSGYTMSVASRTCPPNCSFDVDWRPLGS